MKKKGPIELIKTIAIDMDGTLLNKMQKVSEENKKSNPEGAKRGSGSDHCYWKILCGIEVRFR
ncbi:HAD hydrolase family protein [Peribacillus frigoritolerans]|nr:HAD hydrolase family protein [Peribacillus frigoritolerans]